MKIAIINGPNLNLTGTREAGIYGSVTFEDFLSVLRKNHKGCEISYFQSNIEGELISKLHETGFSCDGIILNAGAYTHTSVALGDAVAAIRTPVVEVHLSNIFAREDFRHVSFVGSKCKGSISGFGMKGYELAILFFTSQTH